MQTKISTDNGGILNGFSVVKKKLADKIEANSYKDIFEETKSKSAEGLWSNSRIKKKKLQAEIEAIIHQKREMVKEINEEVALKREIIMKQSVMENAPELPITGVPAKYLLAGLPSLSTASL